MCGPGEKFMTFAEGNALSPESRHTLNVSGVEHEQMKHRIFTLEAYISNVRIGLGNIGCVPDSVLGWQVNVEKVIVILPGAKPGQLNVTFPPLAGRPIVG
jgi:hypothetical protein